MFSGRWIFGNFVQKFTELGATGSFYSIGGLNTFEAGWHWFITQRETTFKMYDSDVRKWDKGFSNLFHYVISYVLTALCKNAERHYVSWWIQRSVDTIHHLVPPYNLLAYWPLGMDSGNFLTYVGNCLVMWFVYAFRWYEKYGYFHWSDMQEELGLAVCGDDNHTFPTTSRAASFNIERVFSRWMWEVDTEERTSLLDVTFSGRGSVVDPYTGMLLPVIPMRKIKSVCRIAPRTQSPIIRLQRAHAAVILSFPYFLSSDCMEFVVFYEWLAELASRLTGYTRPDLNALYRLYTGYSLYHQGLYTRYSDLKNEYKNTQMHYGQIKEGEGKTSQSRSSS
nr:MAG: RNA-dependent RNA polymerase [Longquan bat nodamuvirus 1]